MIGAATNHLWQSTVFAVVVGLLAAALRRNRAHVRYGLWFAASCKFLIPFSPLMRAGIRINELAAPAPPAVAAAIEQILQPFPARPAPGAAWVAAAVVGAWACGFAAIALTRLRGWRRIRAAVRGGTPVTMPGV